MKTLFCGALSLLIGGVGIWTGWSGLRTYAALRLWPTVRGRVIERATAQIRFVPGTLRYVPLLRYVYGVNGKEFTGEYLFPKRLSSERNTTARRGGGRAWMRAQVAALPDEVDVRYNPADPSEAFILLRRKGDLYVVLAVSAVVLLVGLGLLLVAAVGRA